MEFKRGSVDGKELDGEEIYSKNAGENGRVEYSLGEGEGASYLTINPKSGVIQTAATLDREALSLIR
jgi:hypothetical protein